MNIDCIEFVPLAFSIWKFLAWNSSIISSSISIQSKLNKAKLSVLHMTLFFFSFCSSCIPTSMEYLLLVNNSNEKKLIKSSSLNIFTMIVSLLCVCMEFEMKPF